MGEGRQTRSKNTHRQCLTTMFARPRDLPDDISRPTVASIRTMNQTVEQQLQATAQSRIESLKKGATPKVDVTLSSLHHTLRHAHEEARIAELTGTKSLR